MVGCRNGRQIIHTIIQIKRICNKSTNITFAKVQQLHQQCQSLRLIHTKHSNYLQLCINNSTNESGTKKSQSQPSVEHTKAPEPPPEGLCCGSGCANCVWFVYAEELMTHYQDGGTAAMKSLDRVPDPNIREFLKMELKMRLPKH